MRLIKKSFPWHYAYIMKNEKLCNRRQKQTRTHTLSTVAWFWKTRHNDQARVRSKSKLLGNQGKIVTVQGWYDWMLRKVRRIG